MARMNWDRVRTENRIRQNGQERVEPAANLASGGAESDQFTAHSKKLKRRARRKKRHRQLTNAAAVQEHAPSMSFSNPRERYKCEIRDRQEAIRQAREIITQCQTRIVELQKLLLRIDREQAVKSKNLYSLATSTSAGTRERPHSKQTCAVNGVA